jgi:hypothetical protein
MLNAGSELWCTLYDSTGAQPLDNREYASQPRQVTQKFYSLHQESTGGPIPCTSTQA